MISRLLRESAVNRRRTRRRDCIEKGAWSPAIERALHNDLDFGCVHWNGDRNPERNNATSRDFGGASTPTSC